MSIQEQEHLTKVYHRLDELRGQAFSELAHSLSGGPAGGTYQARSERDANASRYSRQAAELSAVEDGLCFGRLDFDDSSDIHIGRIGVFAGDAEHTPLLIDWRAPAARPFYTATAISREGVWRRRHIHTRARTVVNIDDEILAGDNATGALAGEGALMAALTADRTDRMRDIVATIQAEQDAAIRADLGGVLVVQGGPGTGKTAVALHRAAYLLYTHREQLTRRGVLIVGPNATFLRYIGHVLPSLAETGVLLATIGDLFPGVRTTGAEPVRVAEIKGRIEAAQMVANAVTDRQRVPQKTIEVPFDDDVLLLDPATCERAREAARAAHPLHNLAQPVFHETVIAALARQIADAIGTDPFGGGNLLSAADLAGIRAELRGHDGVRATLDELWPVLTPQQLLEDLFAGVDHIGRAAPWLSAEDRSALVRVPGEFAASDVPLLDEAAQLLGWDDQAERAAARAEREARRAYAQGVLDVVRDAPYVKEILNVDIVAARLEGRDPRTAAQHAAADRNWVFGHVIVDEAQELSAMAWRLLMRRCPSRSMTIVGDLHQTGAAGGATSWSHVLSSYVADRWRLATLTVGYRTPAEILDVAADVLARIDPLAEVPRAVRRSGVLPSFVSAVPAQWPAVVRSAAAEPDAGRVGVVGPASLALDLPFMTVNEVKGLEFDTVVVLDPDAIVDRSPRGLSDLYVALTRATRRLVVVRPPS